MKQLSENNLLDPDPLMEDFVQLTEQGVSEMDCEDWLRLFLQPQLSSRVPEEVKRLFEVARGSAVYGYYFYPLFTLAAEQLLRVAEAAARHKCERLGHGSGPKRFVDQLKHLRKRDTIDDVGHARWTALRKLRNTASHPVDQMIFLPGQAATLFNRVAADINGLFA